MNTDLKFEGITFNATHNATLTEDEFVKNGIRDGQFTGDKQEALLKEAYKQIKAAVPGEAATSKKK